MNKTDTLQMIELLRDIYIESDGSYESVISAITKKYEEILLDDFDEPNDETDLEDQRIEEEMLRERGLWD